MSSNQLQQFQQLIHNSSNVLLIPDGEDPHDALPAALALAYIIKNLGKTGAVFYASPIPAQLNFLDPKRFVISSLVLTMNHVLSVDVRTHAIKQLHYQQEGTSLRIILSSETPGILKKDDIRISHSLAPYDAVIMVGAQTYEQFQDTIPQRTALGLLPLACLDTAPHHAPDGAIVITDETVSSRAEHMTRLIKTLWEEELDELPATALLAGIIAKTHNFQSAPTRPQTFFSAAYLVSRGARQQIIVHALYKSKPLSLIRLLGRAMARLEYHADLHMALAALSGADFRETGASARHIPQLLEELASNLSGIQLVMLVWEEDPPAYEQPPIRAMVKTCRQDLLNFFATRFNGKIQAQTASMLLDCSNSEKAAHMLIGALEEYRGATSPAE